MLQFIYQLIPNFISKVPKSISAVIILVVVILHFVARIGYLTYKMNGKKEKEPHLSMQLFRKQIKVFLENIDYTIVYG